MLGAHFKLVASFIVAMAATLAPTQLQAWTRTLGDTGADTSFGLVRSPNGSIAVGLLKVADKSIVIRRYSSDGTQTFEGSVTNLRGLDMITDGSSNTIFVGERANDRLVVGKYASNGSLSYTTEVMLPSGVNPASARLLYVPGSDHIFVTTTYAGVAYLARVDNWNGSLSFPPSPWMPADSLSHLTLTGDGQIALCTNIGDSMRISKIHPTLLVQTWSINYPTTSGRLRGVASAADGTIYALATARMDYADYDFLVLRVSSTGTLQWANSFNGPSDGHDYASSIALDADGNLILCGSVYDGTVHRAAAMRVNSGDGTRLWTYVGGRVSEPVLDGTPNDPQGISDGTSNTLLVSEVLRGGTRGDVGLYKISPFGAGQWFTWYNHVGNENDSVNRVVWGQNESFYVAGTFGPTTSSDVFVQKYQQAVFTVGPSTVIGGTTATATLTLPDPARADGYTLAATDDSTALTTPASLTVAGSASTGTFEVQTTPVPSHTAGNITLTFGNTTFSTRLSVAAPTPSAVTVTPSSIIGGSNGNVNVTLSGPAPTGGITVALGRSNPIANVPAALYIPGGQSTGTVLFSTGGVIVDTQVTISASLNSVVKTAPVTILRAKLVAVNTVGSVLVGGTTIQGTVYLDGQAAGSGAVVNLSDDSGFVTMPSTVVIPAGYKTATYTAATSAVTSNQTVTITAALNGVTKTTTFTLSLPIHGIVIAPDVLVKNSTSSGMVTLSHPAPTGGITVTLFTGAPTLVGVPSTVFIPAGGTSRAFTITTGNVASPTLVGVFATFNGSTKRKDVIVVP